MFRTRPILGPAIATAPDGIEWSAGSTGKPELLFLLNDPHSAEGLVSDIVWHAYRHGGIRSVLVGARPLDLRRLPPGTLTAAHQRAAERFGTFRPFVVLLDPDGTELTERWVLTEHSELWPAFIDAWLAAAPRGLLAWHKTLFRPPVPAPQFSCVDLSGEVWTTHSVMQHGGLMLVSSALCRGCRRVFEAIEARAESKKADILIVMPAETPEGREYRESLSDRGWHVVEDDRWPRLQQLLDVVTYPTGLCIEGKDGILTSVLYPTKSDADFDALVGRALA